MTRNVEYRCTKHPDPFDCPDNLIHFGEKTKTYGIIVHDGGTSYLEIMYCPWCGAKLKGKTRARAKPLRRIDT